MLWWYKFLNFSDMLLHGQGLMHLVHSWTNLSSRRAQRRSQGDYVPIHDNLILEGVIVDQEHCKLSLRAYLYFVQTS